MNCKKERTIMILVPVLMFAVIVGCVCVFTIAGRRSVYGYVSVIKATSEEYDVMPELVAAIIKAESNFNPDAVSHKGAIGLMQILPTTAEFLADKIGYDKKINLKDVQCNIKIGTAYFSYLKKKFQNERTALCAYNAGEGRVSMWLNDEKCSPDGISLNYIPFAETREYVVKVERFKSEFSAIFSGRLGR